MKVVHVFPTDFPVRGYGGTERICVWLSKALAEMGHEVTLLCNEGSRLPFAKTIAFHEAQDRVESLLPDGTDIVHFWASPQTEPTFPYLVTIEGNGQAGERFLPNTVFASRNHAQRHGWTEFVHNGLDLSEYPLQTKKENYALFMAKVSWRIKNVRGAIRIANKAGIPLFVAGGRAPLLSRRTKSFGMVDGAQKIALLQNAKLFLFPVIWQEPFGIVNIEALACGTPVIATPRGALPEIVDDSCGILADSFDELVEAVSRADHFDAMACRARVARYFSHYQMAETYLSYYKKVIRQRKIRDGFPQAAADANPQARTYYQGYQRFSLF